MSRSNAGIGRKESLEIAVSVPANASNDQRFLTLEAFRRAGFEVLGAPQRALRRGVRIRAPLPQHRDQQARIRARLRPRRGHVRLVADPHGRARERGHHHRGRGAAGRRRPRRGDPRGRPRQRGPAGHRRPHLAAAARRVPAPEGRGRGQHAAPRGGPRAAGPGPARAADGGRVRGLRAADRQDHRSDGRGDARSAAATRKRSAGTSWPASTSWAGPAASRWSIASSASASGSIACAARRIRSRPPPSASRTSSTTRPGYELSDCLTRHFGVWRESETGRGITFDPIFAKDSRLPRAGEPSLVATRRYRPAHNLGHYRFVECGRIREGRPDGDVTPWDEIRFAFDPSLRDATDLGEVEVVRRDGAGAGGRGAVPLHVRGHLRGDALRPRRERLFADVPDGQGQRAAAADAAARAARARAPRPVLSARPRRGRGDFASNRWLPSDTSSAAACRESATGISSCGRRRRSA